MDGIPGFPVQFAQQLALLPPDQQLAKAHELLQSNNAALFQGGFNFPPFMQPGFQIPMNLPHLPQTEGIAANNDNINGPVGNLNPQAVQPASPKATTKKEMSEPASKVPQHKLHRFWRTHSQSVMLYEIVQKRTSTSKPKAPAKKSKSQPKTWESKKQAVRPRRLMQITAGVAAVPSKPLKAKTVLDLIEVQEASESDKGDYSHASGHASEDDCDAKIAENEEEASERDDAKRADNEDEASQREEASGADDDEGGASDGDGDGDGKNRFFPQRDIVLLKEV